MIHRLSFALGNERCLREFQVVLVAGLSVRRDKVFFFFHNHCRPLSILFPKFLSDSSASLWKGVLCFSCTQNCYQLIGHLPLKMRVCFLHL